MEKLGSVLVVLILVMACSEEPDSNFIQVINQTGQPIDEVILYVDNSPFFRSLAPGDTTNYRYYPHDILAEPALSVKISNDTLYTHFYSISKIAHIDFGPPLPRGRHTFAIAIDTTREGTTIQFN
ncbi:hypothetical protein [Tunicatimonas pelagia]|uniref:hypothetical protein n=1 Tax=Tunicatimonas pelagia TaxID=931531 RepID=UPI0026671FB2|nr:hypothetical protein [Tunicatimonas pelagia]WKN44058.1 hypothetical protein P0M28_03630 [Tunicatimonas pelagia]